MPRLEMRFRRGQFDFYLFMEFCPKNNNKGDKRQNFVCKPSVKIKIFQNKT